MILVDTSVWIHKWAGHEYYAAGLDRLLSQNLAAGHEMVYSELLMGASPGHRRERLLEALLYVPWLTAVPHTEVAAMVRARDLAGRGLGWVDACLLAAALAAGCRLWTADRVLEEAAAAAGAGWKP